MSQTHSDAWGSIQPGTIGDNEMPPPGVYITLIASAKAAVSKKGEDYIAIDFRDERTGQTWSDIRVLTQNGIMQEGRVKAAKVLLSQLGLGDVPYEALNASLGTLVGRYYSVEVVASKDINPTSGQPYLNTQVIGVASAPSQPAQAAPAAVAQPAPAAAPLPQQPVPATSIPVQPQPVAAGAGGDGGRPF